MTKQFDTREWIGSAVAPAALAIALIVAVGAASGRQDQPSSATTPADPNLRFRAQEIVKDFGVGYAVVAGDVNGDTRTDVLAISGTELVWFEAPTWEKRVILGAGATTADNVTLAPQDIDGDGDLDIALGAGWTKENTGTLQWVRQNALGAAQAWELFPAGAAVPRRVSPSTSWRATARWSRRRWSIRAASIRTNPTCAAWTPRI